MPIYEYACQQCGNQFEQLVRSGESVSCPACGSDQLRKLISLPAAPARAATLPVCPSEVTDSGCGLPGCGKGRCMGWEQ